VTINISLETIWSAAIKRGTSDFLVGADFTLSYADLDRLVRSWCALFDSRKLVASDRIIIVTASETAAITAFIAAILDGITPVMLTPESAAAKVSGINASIEPSLVVTDASRSGEDWTQSGHLLPTVPTPASKGLFDRLSGRRRTDDLAGSFGLPAAARQPRLPQGDDDLAYILFTSGTTQAPTGVMISRRALLAQLETMTRLFGYSYASRIFNPMVLAHADGMVQGPLVALSNGAAVIRAGAFSVPGIEDWLSAVRRNRATHFITVPTVLAMVDRYAAHSDYFDAPEFSAILSVAARLDTGLWSRLEDRFHRPVLNQYGLTETVASVLYAGRWPGMGAFGTIGTPINCEARIVNRDGEAIDEPNVAGELELRSDQLFTGYWKDSERTAASTTVDGWLHSGDVALRRNDGSYEILGRIKNVIMSGGFLIRPEEVDEALRNHPLVAESVTVGMASDDFEEVPMSLVVLDSSIGETELTQYCRKYLEPQKVPRRIFSVDRIPRGDAGKPQLAAVRSEITSRIASERPASPTDGVAEAILGLCAKVFRVDPQSLSILSSPKTVEGWDSFSQIELILAVEREFGASIPASKVAGIRNVGDLIVAVGAARR
jgi:long-chain acyl-CoA synthetase